MSGSPAVSVVIPAHNAARWLREAIDSVLAQTFGDFEVIVVDDASTDDTLAVARAVADPRLRIVANAANLGAAESRNRGIDAARGEFVAFLDADDLALPLRLERQVAFLRANPEIGMCGTWLQTFGARDDVWTAYPTHDHIKAELLFRSGILGGTVMCRREPMVRLGLRYDRNLIVSEDYELWTRCADAMRLGNVQEVLLRYRIHGENTTLQRREFFRESNRKIRLRQLRKLGIEPSEDELELHCRLADYGPTGPATLAFDLDAVEAWLIRLRASNWRSRYVSDAALLIPVYEYWRRCSLMSDGGARFLGSPAIAGTPWTWRLRDGTKAALGMTLYPLPRS